MPSDAVRNSPSLPEHFRSRPIHKSVPWSCLLIGISIIAALLLRVFHYYRFCNCSCEIFSPPLYFLNSSHDFASNSLEASLSNFTVSSDLLSTVIFLMECTETTSTGRPHRSLNTFSKTRFNSLVLSHGWPWYLLQSAPFFPSSSKTIRFAEHTVFYDAVMLNSSSRLFLYILKVFRVCTNSDSLYFSCILMVDLFIRGTKVLMPCLDHRYFVYGSAFVLSYKYLIEFLSLAEVTFSTSLLKALFKGLQY